MDIPIFWAIAVLGALALVGCFWRMQGGFGPFNLRVVGLVLISTLASLLALAKGGSLDAAMGILGAIAGYLFGVAQNEAGGSSAEIKNTQFGNNAKVAGRDINETLNKIHADIAKIEGNVTRQIEIANRGIEPREYLFNTIYEKSNQQYATAIKQVMGRWESDGWQFVGISSDYQGIDGMLLAFMRPAENGESTVTFFHGSNMKQFP